MPDAVGEPPLRSPRWATPPRQLRRARGRVSGPSPPQSSAHVHSSPDPEHTTCMSASNSASRAAVNRPRASTTSGSTSGVLIRWYEVQSWSNPDSRKRSIPQPLFPCGRPLRALISASASTLCPWRAAAVRLAEPYVPGDIPAVLHGDELGVQAGWACSSILRLFIEREIRQCAHVVPCRQRVVGQLVQFTLQAHQTPLAPGGARGPPSRPVRLTKGAMARVRRPWEIGRQGARVRVQAQDMVL